MWPIRGNLFPRALFPGFGGKAREKRPGDEVVFGDQCCNSVQCCWTVSVLKRYIISLESANGVLPRVLPARSI